jgi:hypothetical protein
MLLETDAFARWRRSRQSAEGTPPLSRLLGGARRSPLWDDGAPIQAELFSVERLEEHARSLAAAQMVTPGEMKGASLAKRLAERPQRDLDQLPDRVFRVLYGSAFTLERETIPNLAAPFFSGCFRWVDPTEGITQDHVPARLYPKLYDRVRFFCYLN